MDLQVEAMAHPQTETANLRQLRSAEHGFFFLFWKQAIQTPISQPKRLFSLVSKSNYIRKPQPKPQNSPGFGLQLDEATTQLYVVSTQKYKLSSGLAIGRRICPSFRVKSE